MRLVSIARARQHTDWFSLKQVILASLLVISAGKIMGTEVVTERAVSNIMDEATEIFARVAKSSESARRGLQLLSEIRVGMRINAKEG
jgi:hypothetical protein